MSLLMLLGSRCRILDKTLMFMICTEEVFYVLSHRFDFQGIGSVCTLVLGIVLTAF